MLKYNAKSNSKRTKSRPYIIFLLISLLVLPHSTDGNIAKSEEVTKSVKFTDSFETAYALFQLRFFNDSEMIEFTPLEYDALFSDVVEVEITELKIAIEKYDDSLNKKGTDQEVKDIHLVFTQTGAPKNQSWGQISYVSIHFLKIDFTIACKITYEGIFSSPLFPYNSTLESTARVEDIFFEVVPSPDYFPIVLLGGILILLLILSHLKDRK